jgi:putative ABC transport system permease protein
LTITSIALVVLVTVAVAGVATIAPGLRGARMSTITALNDPAHPPRRLPTLIALSSRLPVPLLLGLRLLARRTRRAVLAAASLTIAVATIVTVLAVQYDINLKSAHLDQSGQLPGTSTANRVSHVVFVLTAILIVLAAVTTTITTWATVIDSQRATAFARALGATPRQISAGLASAQLLPALAAADLGIPIGLGLYILSSRGGQYATPPILWLLAVIPATLIVVAALTAIPARISARRPVAEVLRSE